MRFASVGSIVLVVLCALGAATPANAQPCAAGISFPNPAIDRNPLIYSASADLRLAVSSSRITLTSNDKVQLRCRSSGGKLTGTNTLPLRGADLASGLFVTDPPTDDFQGNHVRRIFDPRVIFDNYSNRFCIVASEDSAGTTDQYDIGRIHIAVSKTATPNSWASSQWIKCTFGTGADRAPISVQTLGTDFDDTFVDRPSIAVDAQYLYICYREGKKDVDATNSWSVVLVIPKASITDACPNPPCAAPVVEAGLHIDQKMILELAVDYAIDPNAPPGAYLVSNGLPTNFIYNNIRVGRVSIVASPNTWAYSASDYGLGGYSYKLACPNVNGGNYLSGQNCQDTLGDVNQAYGYFFSCAVRPDVNGVRQIWAVQSVRTTVGDCPSQGLLQWYEIPASNPASVVTTRYTLDNGDSAHDPSIAVNANTDVVITFNRAYADNSKSPGIWRLTKPRGASVTLTEEKPGPPVVYRGKYYGQGDVQNAWADYSGTEPDPVDDCQFWAHYITAYATPDDPCYNVSQKWQSWLLRYRVGCPSFAMHGNLDMDQDGDLTDTDVEIYHALAESGDPEMDRTDEGVTDAWDFLDFMNEWNDPG